MDKIDERLGQLETTIENMQVYSNGFNIKLLGIPELKENEDAFETSALCVRLFNQMGGNVTINDIDLAHRITPRKATKSGPKPIVCKFTRRLARNSVMAARKDVSKVDPVLIGLTEEADLSSAMLIDHLSPRMQELYAEAKGFQARYEFDFCWTRNGTIFLRRDAEARLTRED